MCRDHPHLEGNTDNKIKKKDAMLNIRNLKTQLFAFHWYNEYCN